MNSSDLIAANLSSPPSALRASVSSAAPFTVSFAALPVWPVILAPATGATGALGACGVRAGSAGLSNSCAAAPLDTMSVTTSTATPLPVCNRMPSIIPVPLPRGG